MNYLDFSVFPEDVTLLGSPIFSSELLFTIVGIIAWREFRKDRKIKRSEGAARVMTELDSCVNYVREIADRPSLYIYEGYYPDNIPEMGSRDKNLPSYDERPSRLIVNRINKFCRDVAEPVSQIAGKEAKELLVLRLKLQKTANTLSNAIAAQFMSTQEIADATKPHISACREEMDDLQKRFEDILLPLIEGRCFLFFLMRKIKGYLYRFAEKLIVLKPHIRRNT